MANSHQTVSPAPPSGYAGLDLSNQVAVVTGAMSDMGAAVVNLLVARGAQVVAADLATVGTTSIEHGIAIHSDVGDEASVIATIAAARELGPVTMLVNVAAATGMAQVMADTEITEMDPAVWDAAYAINARGAC